MASKIPKPNSVSSTPRKEQPSPSFISGKKSSKILSPSPSCLSSPRRSFSLRPREDSAIEEAEANPINFPEGINKTQIKMNPVESCKTFAVKDNSLGTPEMTRPESSGISTKNLVKNKGTCREQFSKVSAYSVSPELPLTSSDHRLLTSHSSNTAHDNLRLVDTNPVPLCKDMLEHCDVSVCPTRSEERFMEQSTPKEQFNLPVIEENVENKPLHQTESSIMKEYAEVFVRDTFRTAATAVTFPTNLSTSTSSVPEKKMNDTAKEEIPTFKTIGSCYLPHAEDDVKAILDIIEEDDEEEEVVFDKTSTGASRSPSKTNLAPPASEQTKISECNNVAHSAPCMPERFPSLITFEVLKEQSSEMNSCVEIEPQQTDESDVFSNPFVEFKCSKPNSSLYVSSMTQYTTLTSLDEEEEQVPSVDKGPCTQETFDHCSPTKELGSRSKTVNSKTEGWMTCKPILSNSNQEGKAKQLFEYSSSTVGSHSGERIKEPISSDYVEVSEKSPNEVKILYAPRSNLNNTISNVVVDPTYQETHEEPHTCQKNDTTTYLSMYRNQQQAEHNLVKVVKQAYDQHQRAKNDASNATEDHFFKSEVQTQTSKSFIPRKTEVKAPQYQPMARLQFQVNEDTATDAIETDTDFATDNDYDDPELLFSIDIQGKTEDTGSPPKSTTLSSSTSPTTTIPQCPKKAKTIFCMERLQSPTQMEESNRFGQNGDGCGVQGSSKLAKEFSFSNLRLGNLSSAETIRSKHSMESTKSVGFRNENRSFQRLSNNSGFPSRSSLPASNYQRRPSSTSTSTSFKGILDEIGNIKDDPLVSIKKGTVEISPKFSKSYLLSPTPSSNASFRTNEVDPSTRKCQAVMPVGSTLILQRMAESRSNVFSKPINLHNSTSCVYGFKVCVKSPAKSLLNVIPKMGVISAHSEVSVNVATVKNEEFKTYDWAEMFGRNAISVKIFRFYSNNPEDLQRIYEELETNHPELIFTQTIEKIILWDSNDLPGMFHQLNAINDKEERASIKAEVHKSTTSISRRQSCTLYQPHTSSSLKAICQDIQQQISGLSTNMTEIFEEIKHFQNSQLVICFAAMILLVFSMILMRLNIQSNRLDLDSGEPEGTFMRNLASRIGRLMAFI